MRGLNGFSFKEKKGKIMQRRVWTEIDFSWMLFVCLSGWEYQGLNCYKYFNIKLSWEKAAELCRRWDLKTSYDVTQLGRMMWFSFEDDRTSNRLDDAIHFFPLAYGLMMRCSVQKTTSLEQRDVVKSMTSVRNFKR